MWDAHSRRWRIVATAVTLVATASVASTYSVFSNMYDEPAHIAAGMEWLSRGTYTYEPQHPPLSRIAAAVGPWLAGAHSLGNAAMYEEGRRILGRGAHYQRTLTLARLGELPFFFVLAFVTWTWARRLADERTAAIATLFVAANPNILAHAGVAGTDIGPAAMMPAALLALVVWLERPTTARSVMLGAVVALCGLTKFSAIAYWIVAAGLVSLTWALGATRAELRGTIHRFVRPKLIAVGVAAFVTWAVYRFDFGRVGNVILPAPAFWTGLRDFFQHGTSGHPSFLLGEVRQGGWWYYDLVAFGVKTPIPLLIFGAIGCVALARTTDREHRVERLAPLAGIVAVLLLASMTPVDIGIRLDLPLYPLLAVVAAIGFARAMERAPRPSTRMLVGALCALLVADTALTHPDYIAYFNGLAGPHPETVLVDSNLDWGQDLYRLRDVANALHVDSLRVHYFGTAEFAAVGLSRARRLRPNEHATGWVAASETFYAGLWSGHRLDWLHQYTPVAEVGRSIRLYFIRP